VKIPKCLCTSLSARSKAGKSFIYSTNELCQRPLHCGNLSLSFLGKSAAQTMPLVKIWPQAILS
jgi:hypothetical protein